MADNVKEAKALDKITKLMNKLDVHLAKLHADKSQDHHIREDLERHRVMHEVKKTLHEVNKFDKYDPKKYEDFMKDYEGIVNTMDNKK